MTDLKKDTKKDEDVAKIKTRDTDATRSNEPQTQVDGSIPIVFAKNAREVARILLECKSLGMIYIFLRMVKDSSVTKRIMDLIRTRGAQLTEEELLEEIEKIIMEELA
jgi:hypothetical protein